MILCSLDYEATGNWQLADRAGKQKAVPNLLLATSQPQAARRQAAKIRRTKRI